MAATYYGLSAMEISEAWHVPIGTIKTACASRSASCVTSSQERRDETDGLRTARGRRAGARGAGHPARRRARGRPRPPRRVPELPAAGQLPRRSDGPVAAPHARGRAPGRVRAARAGVAGQQPDRPQAVAWTAAGDKGHRRRARTRGRASSSPSSCGGAASRRRPRWPPSRCARAAAPWSGRCSCIANDPPCCSCRSLAGRSR